MTATKAVHCPATLGPTAVVHVTHPGYICILQGIEHPPHTQRLWSEMNLKGFFSSFCCASHWTEAILWLLFLLYYSVHNVCDHNCTFSSQEVKLLSSGKELMLTTSLFILTALLLFPCEDQKLRRKGQTFCTKWYFKSVQKLDISENFLTIDGEVLQTVFHCYWCYVDWCLKAHIKSD